MPEARIVRGRSIFLLSPAAANHILRGGRDVAGEFLLDEGDLVLHLGGDVPQAAPQRRGGRGKVVRNTGGKAEESLNLKRTALFKCGVRCHCTMSPRRRPPGLRHLRCPDHPGLLA